MTTSEKRIELPENEHGTSKPSVDFPFGQLTEIPSCLHSVKLRTVPPLGLCFRKHTLIKGVSEVDYTLMSRSSKSPNGSAGCLSDGTRTWYLESRGRLRYF